MPERLIHLSKYVIKIPEVKDEHGIVTRPAQTLVQKKGETYRSLERARKKDNRAAYFSERRAMNG